MSRTKTSSSVLAMEHSIAWDAVEKIGTGASIPGLFAVLVLLLRYLASIHPPTNGKAAAKIREQIRLELAKAEEFNLMRETLRNLQDESSTTVREVRLVRGDIHELRRRVERLEEA